MTITITPQSQITFFDKLCQWMSGFDFYKINILDDPDTLRVRCLFALDIAEAVAQRTTTPVDDQIVAILKNGFNDELYWAAFVRLVNRFRGADGKIPEDAEITADMLDEFRVVASASGQSTVDGNVVQTNAGAINIGLILTFVQIALTLVKRFQK